MHLTYKDLEKKLNAEGRPLLRKIAFEFASCVSAEFKLFIIKDYQRLKSDEKSKISLDWNLKREIASNTGRMFR